VGGSVEGWEEWGGGRAPALEASELGGWSSQQQAYCNSNRRHAVARVAAKVSATATARGIRQRLAISERFWRCLLVHVEHLVYTWCCPGSQLECPVPWPRPSALPVRLDAPLAVGELIPPLRGQWCRWTVPPVQWLRLVAPLLWHRSLVAPLWIVGRNVSPYAYTRYDGGCARSRARREYAYDAYDLVGLSLLLCQARDSSKSGPVQSLIQRPWPASLAARWHHILPRPPLHLASIRPFDPVRVSPAQSSV